MIALNETDVEAREVPFTLPTDADPLVGLTGHVFTLGEVKVRLPGGGAWVDVPVLSIREVGFGRYAARLQASEVMIAGNVLISAQVTGAQPYRGSEVIGELGGEIPVGGTGYLLFYLADATDPVYGAPLTGAFDTLPGASASVAWPGAAHVAVDPADVVEFGEGLYGIPVSSSDSATRGKAYYYATATGAQRYESYVTILSATVFTVIEPEPPLEPIEVPVVFGDATYTDHVTEALDRLCQQFRDEENEDEDDAGGLDAILEMLL